MGRFTPNLSAVTAGIPLLDKGQYAFSIGEMKPFSRVSNRDGIDVTVWGVRTSIKVTEGDSNIGDTIPVSLYLHTEESEKMSKQFLLAAYGKNASNRSDEADFNSQFTNEDDWVVDDETGELGDVWKGCQGKLIRANVTQTINKRDQSQQNQFRWLPF